MAEGELLKQVRIRSGALLAVAARLAPFWRNCGGIREDCCRAVPDPLSVLVDGRLQFSQDRPRLVRTARGKSLHAELSDAIIQTTRAQVHGNKTVLETAGAIIG